MPEHPPGRRWVLDSRIGRVEIRVPNEGVDPAVFDHSSDEHPWYPISDRIRRFGELVSSEEISLTLVDGCTVVAAADGITAAIDLVDSPVDVPRAWHVRPTAIAAVPFRQWNTMLWSARNLPTDIGEVTYPMPPRWLQIADREVTLHVDWSDFLPSRSTYRIAALEHHGSATVAVPHLGLSVFSGAAGMTFDDGDEPISITVGEAHDDAGEPLGDVMSMSTTNWRIVLWNEHPLRARWASRIEAELADDGLEVRSSSGAEWVVVVGGEPSTPHPSCPIVHVTVHHGHPDIARVSAALATGMVETLELLRELSALNGASTGIRYWFDTDTVHAAADVRCSALSTLPGVVRAVAAAVDDYGQVLSSLGA